MDIFNFNFFSIGCIFVVFGAVGHFVTKFNFAKTLHDKPNTKDFYMKSSNPMYFLFHLVILGATLITQSVLLAIVLIISFIFGF